MFDPPPPTATGVGYMCGPCSRIGLEREAYKSLGTVAYCWDCYVSFTARLGHNDNDRAERFAAAARLDDLVALVARESNGDSPLRFQHLPDPLIIPPLDWHARGLWCRPTHGELAGGEKTLKSYLGNALDIAVAGGVDVLGRWHVDKTQRVLALVGEGGEHGYWRRVVRLCAAYGISVDDVRPNLRYSVQASPVTSPRFLDSVKAELDQFQPDLVHLDPWYAYAPGGVDARNLYEQGAALERVGSMCRDGGASVMLNNHFNQTGSGAGLQRISMAGHAEWSDSWMLVAHRRPADVERGSFRLKMSVGSRQWGGADYHIDLELGRWNDELNEHDGALRWKVTVATDEDAVDPLEAKVADYEARLVGTWRRRRGAKTPWPQSEWFDRTTGAKADLRVAWLRLLDLGRIVEVPIGVVDAAGRTQPSGRFTLVESPLETGET